LNCTSRNSFDFKAAFLCTSFEVFIAELNDQIAFSLDSIVPNNPNVLFQRLPTRFTCIKCYFSDFRVLKLCMFRKASVLCWGIFDDRERGDYFPEFRELLLVLEGLDVSDPKLMCKGVLDPELSGFLEAV
jgi:hypothetical protein